MVWRWSARQHGDGRGRGTGRAAARRRAAGVRDAACTRAGVRADRVRVLVGVSGITLVAAPRVAGGRRHSGRCGRRHSCSRWYGQGWAELLLLRAAQADGDAAAHHLTSTHLLLHLLHELRGFTVDYCRAMEKEHDAAGLRASEGRKKRERCVPKDDSILQ